MSCLYSNKKLSTVRGVEFINVCLVRAYLMNLPASSKNTAKTFVKVIYVQIKKDV